MSFHISLDGLNVFTTSFNFSVKWYQHFSTHRMSWRKELFDCKVRETTKVKFRQTSMTDNDKHSYSFSSLKKIMSFKIPVLLM